MEKENCLYCDELFCEENFNCSECDILETMNNKICFSSYEQTLKNEFKKYCEIYKNPLDIINYSELYEKIYDDLFKIIDKNTQGYIRKDNLTEKMLLSERLFDDMIEPLSNLTDEILKVGFMLGYKQKLFDESLKPGADQTGADETNRKIINYLLEENTKLKRAAGQTTNLVNSSVGADQTGADKPQDKNPGFLPKEYIKQKKQTYLTETEKLLLELFENELFGKFAEQCELSMSYIENTLCRDNRTVRRALKSLTDRNIIIKHGQNKRSLKNIWSINTNYSMWRE